MSILSSTFNLSNNVKYINAKVDTTPSGGGALTGTATLQDKKDLMHIIQRAISTEIDDTASNPKTRPLGWERFDGIYGGSKNVGTSADIIADPAGYNDSAVYGFLRARCYDYGTSPRTSGDSNENYKYLRLKLFERDEKTLLDNEFDDTARDPRYISSDNVLVMRWDMFSDWNSTVLGNMLDSTGAFADSDAVNGGINIADADGYGKTDGSLAYEAQSDIWNTTRFGGNTKFSKLVNSNNSTNKASGNSPIIASTESANGVLPRGNAMLYDIYYDRYAQTGFGHKDLSYKNQFNELTFSIDGNFTLWMFGDGDNVSTNKDSSHGTDNFRGVDSEGAQARYLAMFVNQAQDQDPELNSPYNTVMMVSEYKKEFGEAAPTDEFIHNGVKFNAHSLLMNNGMATPNSFNSADFYALGSGTVNHGGNVEHRSSNTQGTHRSVTVMQHGTTYRNADGTIATSNALTNFTDFISRANFSGNNFNVNINTTGSNTGSRGDAGFYHDFEQNVEYGEKGDGASLLDLDHTVTDVVDGTRPRIEISGNIMMGPSSSTHNTSLASAGAASNSSHSNVRDKNLGNFIVRTFSGNTETENVSKNNTYGGSTYAGWNTATNGAVAIGSGAELGQELHWYGADGAQFMLTEYPTRVLGTGSTPRGSGNTDQRKLETAESINKFDAYGTPQSGRQYLSSTRLHMGWMGYVGHLNAQTCYSLNEAFYGSRHGMFGDNKGLQPIGSLSEHIPGKSDVHKIVSYGPGIPMVANMLDSNDGNTLVASGDSDRHSFQEFHPTPEQQVNYSVYEPILSVGNMKMTAGGIFGQHGTNDNTLKANLTEANDNNAFFAANNGNLATVSAAGIVEAGNPGGTDKKLSAFAMLGRTYGLKIFGPYRHNKYNFLDAVSIQTDDDGFYAVNPTNSVEHWVVPMNHTQAALLLKK